MFPCDRLNEGGFYSTSSKKNDAPRILLAHFPNLRTISVIEVLTPFSLSCVKSETCKNKKIHSKASSSYERQR